MATEHLQRARQLIFENRIEEARAILVQLDHPTARQWLAKLDEKAFQAEPSLVTQKRQPNEASVLITLVTVLALVAFVVAIYGAFVRPTLAAGPTVEDIQLTTRLDAVESSLVDANLDGRLVSIEASLTSMAQQGSGATQWEYRTLVIDGALAGPFGMASDFGGRQVENLGRGLTAAQDGEPSVIAKLNELGEEGWELVSFAFIAGERVGNFVFKRPVAFQGDT